MTALNRTFAFARVYGNEVAIKEAKKLRLEKNSYYHSLLGHLHSETAVQKAISHYQQAIALTKSSAEKRTLSKAITSLERNTSLM
jgi:predicted RNA polymerase sigma factor